MPRFAANISLMFTELPFADRFAAAAAAGFEAVEFLFPYEHAPEEIAGWLSKSGLRNVLFNMPPGDFQAGERGIAGLAGREDEFHAGVERALVYAEALGTPRLHAMAGLVPNGGVRDACREIFVGNLRRAARRVAEHGLTLLIEPINTRDMPGYLLNSQADAYAILQDVGEPNLKIQLDLYHAQIVEGDLSMLLKRYVPDAVGHIQIAGVPDRHEPDEGEVNYPFLFRLIDELGYGGWIGCEYRPRGRTEDGLGWLPHARWNKP